jgi:hypothetical protein
MKISRVLGITCLLTVLFQPFANPASAMDGQGRFLALGVGKRSCEDFIKFRQKKLELAPEQYEIAQHVIEHWVAGFLTAHNFYVTDTYDVKGNATPEDLAQWLENYCKANPTRYFAEGVIALTFELHPKRVTAGILGEQR